MAARASALVTATDDASARSAAHELVIIRVFDAPRRLVFKVWTDPAHLARWWGPQGFTLVACEADVRPGGAWRRCMRSPSGSVHVKLGIYREIVEPERLVFTYADEDAEGRLGPETLVSVTLTESAGRTELILRQTGFATAALRDGHRGGWTSALDRLAEHLAGA
jgi:uncharacterized protein YndB with AHSA1/START domain